MFLSVVSGLLVVSSLAYLLLLLASAALARSQRRDMTALREWVPQLAVVIPAHNEELVLAATLHSLQEQDYSADRFDVIVVADNCDDTTVSIAREWGVRTVLERTDTVQRGKGYALEWAFSSLLGANSPVKEAAAFVIVDADTALAPDFLSIMARRLNQEVGTTDPAQAIVALQGRYGVLNSREGWRTGLMTAAFDLVNHVRLLGAANLGFTVGLKGNGMLFTRALLQKARWQGRSITEDIDYGLDLLLEHNIKVRYEPTARVWAQMPTDDAPASSQRERWERGRYRLLGQRVPTLLLQGVRRNNLALLVAGTDLMIPPLAELTGLLLLWGICTGIGVVTHRLPIGWFYAWVVGLVGFFTYVLAGLKASGAKRETFVALLYAPAYVAWKFALYIIRFVVKPFRRSSQKKKEDVDAWIRTERRALEPATTSTSSMLEKEQRP
jgi:cellulose synthase/poly-beta-1,6-N-acetylglucosamine synthase-like glycosyltransferase